MIEKSGKDSERCEFLRTYFSEDEREDQKAKQAIEGAKEIFTFLAEKKKKSRDLFLKEMESFLLQSASIIEGLKKEFEVNTSLRKKLKEKIDSSSKKCASSENGSNPNGTSREISPRPKERASEANKAGGVEEGHDDSQLGLRRFESLAVEPGQAGPGRGGSGSESAGSGSYGPIGGLKPVDLRPDGSKKSGASAGSRPGGLGGAQLEVPKSSRPEARSISDFSSQGSSPETPKVSIRAKLKVKMKKVSSRLARSDKKQSLAPDEIFRPLGGGESLFPSVNKWLKSGKPIAKSASSIPDHEKSAHRSLREFDTNEQHFTKDEKKIVPESPRFAADSFSSSPSSPSSYAVSLPVPSSVSKRIPLLVADHLPDPEPSPVQKPSPIISSIPSTIPSRSLSPYPSEKKDPKSASQPYSPDPRVSRLLSSPVFLLYPISDCLRCLHHRPVTPELSIPAALAGQARLLAQAGRVDRESFQLALISAAIALAAPRVAARSAAPALPGETLELETESWRFLSACLGESPRLAAFDIEGAEFRLRGCWDLEEPMSPRRFEIFLKKTCRCFSAELSETRLSLRGRESGNRAELELAPTCSGRLVNAEGKSLGSIVTESDGRIYMIDGLSRVKISLARPAKADSTWRETIRIDSELKSPGSKDPELKGPSSPASRDPKPPSNLSSGVSQTHPSQPWLDQRDPSDPSVLFAFFDSSIATRLPPTDSRLRPDLRALLHGETQLASTENQRLEARKNLESSKKEASSPWFERVEANPPRFESNGRYWRCRESNEWPPNLPSLFL